jgi:hypothetical protein
MPRTLEEDHPTAEQLRDDIDRGRTGNKVPWPDPASVPLGTDDEAAGTSLSRDAIRTARESEQQGPSHAPPEQGLGHAWILIGFILVLLAGVLVWAIAAA